MIFYVLIRSVRNRIYFFKVKIILWFLLLEYCGFKFRIWKKYCLRKKKNEMKSNWYYILIFSINYCLRFKEYICGV